VFGAGYQPLLRTSWARREKRDDGMVLLGKGCPVTGSMIVFVKRPASSSGLGTMANPLNPLSTRVPS
jgi:hypothetical protein